MPKNYQLTIEDWNEALRLLKLSADELHTLRPAELQGGANLLRSVGDACSKRALSITKFAEAKQGIGAQ